MCVCFSKTAVGVTLKRTPVSPDKPTTFSAMFLLLIRRQNLASIGEVEYLDVETAPKNEMVFTIYVEPASERACIVCFGRASPYSDAVVELSSAKKISLLRKTKTFSGHCLI